MAVTINGKTYETVGNKIWVTGAPGGVGNSELIFVRTSDIGGAPAPEYREVTKEQALQLAQQHADKLREYKAIRATGQQVQGGSSDPDEYLASMTARFNSPKDDFGRLLSEEVIVNAPDPANPGQTISNVTVDKYKEMLANPGMSAEDFKKANIQPTPTPKPSTGQSGATGGATAPEGQTNIGTAEAPLWVPKGSAAETNYLTGNGGTTGTGTGGTTGGAGTIPGTTTGTGKVDKATIVAWLKTQPDYMSLTPEMQADIESYIDILGIDDLDTQKNLLNALTTASATVDPYYREIINATKDELTRAFGSAKGDLASQTRDLDLRIQQIKEDLATGKTTLSLDEQSELKRQQVTYETEKQNVLDSAANTGLTFSSRRALAESKLDTENQDIVQSTRRSFQEKLSTLQTAADRGNLEAKNQLSDYERLYGENITKLGRVGESALGTSNMPPLEGYTPLGGLSGTIPEEQRNSVLEGATALASLRNL